MSAVYSRLIGLGLVTGLLVMAPMITQAADGFGDLESGITVGGNKNIDSIAGEGGGVVRFVSIIINIVLGVIVAVGVLFVLFGAYTYMTAGGNAGQVDQAKKIIFAAILGIVLALLAQVLLNLISPQFAAEVREPVLNLPTSGN